MAETKHYTKDELTCPFHGDMELSQRRIYDKIDGNAHETKMNRRAIWILVVIQSVHLSITTGKLVVPLFKLLPVVLP